MTQNAKTRSFHRKALKFKYAGEMAKVEERYRNENENEDEFWKS